MTHRWVGRNILGERNGQLCRIVAKGRGRAALVEFEDGYRALTTVALLRRLPDPATLAKMRADARWTMELSGRGAGLGPL